jgi:1-aminocyclopropane-1-carboxylate deaminase/D-cysteine desulfhydrase-like pyridoxal-dependent ACC family enzyme
MSAVHASSTPITRDDLERKFRELDGEVAETKQSATSTLVTVGAVVAVGVIAIAFLAGRRKGKKRTTVVEVRRI